MKFNYILQTAKVVGTPTDGFWSQVHTFFPEDKIKKEKRGDLLAILVISQAGEGVAAVAAGREILGRIHEEYYGNLDGSACDRLKLAIEKVSQENDNLEIVAGVVFGNVLYLATLGGGKVLLKRFGQTGVLISGGEGLKSTSGFLEDNDLLVFGSAKFFSAVGDGVLRAALENNLVDEAVEILAPIILGRGEMSKAAAIIVSVKKQEEEEIRPMEESVPEPKQEEKPLDIPPVKKPFRLKLPFKNFRKPIYVKNGAETKKKRLYFLASLVLLSLFSLSLFLGIKKRNLDRKETQARNLLKQAEEKLNQSKEIAASNPSQGKVLGEEVIRLADEAALISKKNSQEASVIKEQTQNLLSSLATESLVNEPTVFMDLNLIIDGAFGNAFTLIDKDLVILDSGKKKIYLLNFEKKSNKIIDSSIEKGSLVTILAEKVLVMGSEGIWEVLLSDQKSSVKIKTDSDWQEVVGLSSFGSNVYLLDKGANLIWRYSGTESGFGKKANWLVDKPDLGSAVSMAIDGSIWVLEKDKILKFTFGKQESFSLTKMPASPRGEPENFGEPIKIWTSADNENLYVLDKGIGKIWVIAKNGEYRGSFAGEWIKSSSDIVTVEGSKKIFVLSGTKIYEIGIK